MRQVGDNAAHAIINKRVNDLLAAAGRAQQACRPEQSEMMTYQRTRHADADRDFADGAELSQAREQDAQSRRFAEHAQNFRRLGELLVD